MDTANHLQALTEPQTRRLDEVVDVLYGMAGFDFTRRATVGQAGDALDAVSAAVNMTSEELASALGSIDEQHRTLEAATRAKSQFMANVSHEIRTPLTALLGFADLLSDHKLNESERLNYALIIRRNGEHLLSLINDILDLSKIEAGKLVVETVDFSLGSLLADIESLLRVRAMERSIGFGIELATPIPATLQTDPTRLRQVILNLLGNAIKFTEFGSVRLVVRWLEVPAPRLVFDVVDTGIGMSAEALARLFQPFEQADSSMTRRFGGSGLGLAISKPLAEALGGSLSVTSVDGEGSTFTLDVPAPVTEETTWLRELPGAVSPESGADAGETPERLAGTVLLAEDGPDNQLLVGTILRGRGLAVHVAENGQVAVERALSAWRDGKPFDLILMDMQMPLLDGYSATMHLREMGYRGAIVALTAHAMPGERERCFAAGCNDYMSKPVDRRALIATVARHISPGAASREAPAATDGPLLSSYAHDPDMAELVQRFVQNLPRRIVEIRTAGGRAEPEALMHIAHQLKGAAGGYGFAPISEAAARLEQGLRGANHHQIPALVEELIALCQRACVQ